MAGSTLKNLKLKTKMEYLIGGALLLICLWYVGSDKLPLSKSGLIQTEAGDSTLAGCDGLLNCASTLDSASEIQPIMIDDLSKLDFIRNSLKESISEETGFTKYTKASDNYMVVLFKSKLLKFPDDLEVLIDEKQKVIHFRSSSRYGVSDIGVNQKRISSIRENALSRIKYL